MPRDDAQPDVREVRAAGTRDKPVAAVIAPGELAIALVAVFLGGIAGGATGFGAAIVAAPVVALTAPSLLPFVLWAPSLLTSALVLRAEREQADWRAVRRLAATHAPAALGGAWLLQRMSVSHLTVAVLAAVVLGLVASTLPRRRPFPPLAFGGAGLLAGLSGATTGMDGPPVVAVLAGADPPRFRATCSGFFVVAAWTTLAAWWGTGALEPSALAVGAAALPASPLGVLVGRRAHAWLTRNRLRWAALALAVVAVARAALSL